jgi:hypothetical protein
MPAQSNFDPLTRNSQYGGIAMTEPEEKPPKHEDIERRAYELYLASGSEDGHAEEHWLIAEDELTREHADTAKEGAPLTRRTAGQSGQGDD